VDCPDSPPASGSDVLYYGNGNDFLLSNPFSVQVAYGENGNDNLSVNSLNSVLFGGDGDDRLNLDSYNFNGLFFGGNGNDTFRYGFESGSGRKTYAWGGADSDSFIMSNKTSRSIDWIMDFDARSKPIDGGDKIDLFLFGINFIWDESTTKLEKKSADKEHPFLSEDAEYYELRVNTSTDENIENWLSVFNLVGIDGTEITLQGLIANGNLV
jgi:hypothetical protein